MASDPAMARAPASPSPPALPAASTAAPPPGEAPPASTARREPSPERAPAADASGSLGAAAPEAPARLFAACTYSEGSYGRNCDSLFVTMTEVSPARCVQLTIDNCGENDRGLGGRAPDDWSLDSGTVSSDPEQCELGVFYPGSTPAQRASGTIRWNESTRLPSDVVLELTLETSSLEGTATIEVVTPAPLVPAECDR